MGFPGGSDRKESARNAGDLGLIPGSGRYPGEGNGHPLQCSCLQQSMERGVWWATVHGNHKESDSTEQLTHTQCGGEHGRRTTVRMCKGVIMVGCLKEASAKQRPEGRESEGKEERVPMGPWHQAEDRVRQSAPLVSFR